MKSLALVVSVFLTSASGNLFAQPTVPTINGTVTVEPVSTGLKITKVTGTVQLMKDGMVVLTLKPGDAIPALVDPSMTFVVIDGSIVVRADGQALTATAGSNFTVSTIEGRVNVVVAGGAPVQVTNASGNTTVIAPNSNVNMNTANGQTVITVQRGSAMVTTASGGEPTNVQAGQTITVSAPVTAPATAATVPAVVAGETKDVVNPEVLSVPPASVVVPTQEVTESNPVSGSNP